MAFTSTRIILLPILPLHPGLQFSNCIHNRHGHCLSGCSCEIDPGMLPKKQLSKHLKWTKARIYNYNFYISILESSPILSLYSLMYVSVGKWLIYDQIKDMQGNFELDGIFWWPALLWYQVFQEAFDGGLGRVVGRKQARKANFQFSRMGDYLFLFTNL